MNSKRSHSLSVKKAKTILVKSLKLEFTCDSVAVSRSMGRIKAGSIIAHYNDPPYSRSAMDGYAVRASDLSLATPSAPVVLHKIASITIGEEQKQHEGEGTCVWVPTGAVVPPFYDSVVQVELTAEENSEVRFTSGIREGSNVDPIGYYHKNGDILVRSGSKISSRDIAILSALGIQEIEVIRKPRIGIVSTGNELIPQGAQKHSDKVYDSNGHAIKSLLEETGGPGSAIIGISPDNANIVGFPGFTFIP